MSKNSQNINHHNGVRLLCILLMVLSWISVNIYLPALPKLIAVFHSNEANLKLSLTLFFTSFAISQLLWGPISEKYGRKKPLMIGMALTSLGVLMAMFSNSVTTFNSGRFIEAVGLGCAPVLGRAILSDLLEKTLLSITWAYATITANIMPALAPIIGGHLLFWFGWRAIFLFLLLYSAALYWVTYKHLPETHQDIQPNLQFKNVLSQYASACTHRIFMGYLLPYFLLSGAMIGYYASMPFIFISKLHVAPQIYGYYSVITVLTYIAGALLNRFLSLRYTLPFMVLLGTMFALAASLVICLLAAFFALTELTVLLPLALFTFAAGFVSPSSNTGSLLALRHLAGAGSAIAGSGIYAASAVLSTIATSLPLDTLWPLAMYILIVSLISFLAFYGMVYRNKKALSI